MIFAANRRCAKPAAGLQASGLSKVYPFLKEVREKAQTPHYFQRVEKVATRSKEGRERLQMMSKRAEARRAAAAAKAS